jgi:hypothetical protein
MYYAIALTGNGDHGTFIFMPLFSYSLIRIHEKAIHIET